MHSCPKCREHQPEKCPLIRKGIMSALAEHCRDHLPDDDDDEYSAKMYDLDVLFRDIKKKFLYGSTALLRVDPGENQGQDIVPVLAARKAPCPWSRDYTSADGMFVDGDTILWLVDLEQVPLRECAEPRMVKYVVPKELSATHKFRAVPLKCAAGLGQGLSGYMDEVAQQGSSKHFSLRAGVVEDARSNPVLLSAKPSSAFHGFNPVEISAEDERRSPLRPELFDVGTVVRRKFSGPLSSRGKRLWRTKRLLNATVVGVKTNESLRRHWYKLRWNGDQSTVLGAKAEIYVEKAT